MIIIRCKFFLSLLPFCSHRGLEAAAKGLPFSCCFVFSLNSSRLAFVVLPKNFLFAAFCQ